VAKKKRYYDKKMSARDGAMISGKLGIALMPTEVMMKYYPKDGSYLPENLNDGMSGIDKQMRDDVTGAMKDLSDTKY
jgi:hypothetical protein